VPVGVCQSYYIRTCRMDERHGGIREGESLRADYKGKGWLCYTLLSSPLSSSFSTFGVP